MKSSASRLGTLAVTTLLGAAALAGCTSSKGSGGAQSAGSGAGGTTASAPAPSPSQSAASPTDQGTAGQGSNSQGQGTKTSAHPTTASKPKTAPTSVALPASFPTTGPNDIQVLREPMHAVEASNMNQPLDFQRELDPSTTANALRTWVLNPFSPDLIDYDQTAYGLHGEIKPYMDVAIGSPKIVPSGNYPDFIGGIMAAAGATEDLYTPPSYSSHLSGYSLTIDCAHETLKGRTVCVWSGATPGGGHVPFVGVLVILSTVPTSQAAVIAADVATGLTS